VATGDKAAGADIVMSMTQRAGKQITELDASYVVMISRPDVVANVVGTAWQAVS
jgi:hypothetical protein